MEHKNMEFIKNTTIERRKTMPVPIISNAWTITEKRPEYRIKAQPHIQIKGKKINIGVEDVERAIKSLRNGRACGSKGIYAELLKSRTRKLYRMLSNIISPFINGHLIPDQ